MLEITTADGHVVKEGDRVFSHYTCTWGVIENPKQWSEEEGVWFDFRQDDGKAHLLNGDRIAKNEPEWMKQNRLRREADAQAST